MFALLETETVPRSGVLARALRRLRRDNGVQLTEEYRWGTKVLRVVVTHEPEDKPKLREKRASAAFAEIARRGVRAVVLPRGFPYLPDESYGIAAANPVSLYRHAAPMLCRYAADALRRRTPENLSIAICAPCVTQELISIVQSLILRFRSLSLCVPRDITRFASALNAQYGVSVLENPTPAQLSGTDIYVMLAERQIYPKPDSVVLWLDGTSHAEHPGKPCNGAEFALPQDLSVVADTDPNALLTVLCACGAVNLRTLAVRKLLWNGETVEF